MTGYDQHGARFGTESKALSRSGESWAPRVPLATPFETLAARFDTMETLGPDTTVDRVMIREVVHVEPTTKVGTALDLMAGKHVAALPVVDDGRCVGIVTASDLATLIRSITKVLKSDYPHYDDCLWAVDLVQQQAGSDPIRNIMSEILVAATPETTVAEAATMMIREDIHHLPVIADDKLVGFVSSLDLFRPLIG